MQNISKIWNDNFDLKTNVNGKTITVGEQDFDSGTIMIKEEDANIVFCPMHIDESGDVYFLYDNEQIYLKWI